MAANLFEYGFKQNYGGPKGTGCSKKNEMKEQLYFNAILFAQRSIKMLRIKYIVRIKSFEIILRQKLTSLL